MPEFQYWAKTEFGDTVSGRLTASSPDDLSHLLTLRGLIVQRLEEAAIQEVPAAEPLILSEDDFEGFAAHVATMSQVQLPLTTSLRTLAEESSRPALRRALFSVLADVEQGRPLEEAFANLSSAYPQRLAPLVEAGVRTGKLASLLQHAVEHLRQTAELRRRVWISLAYPVILCLTAMALISFMMLVLVPPFKKIFDDFGTDLPSITKVLLGISDAVMNYWYLPLLAIAVLLVIGACAAMAGLWSLVARRTNLSAYRLRHEILGWLPMIGTVLKASSLSGFFRLLADLVDAGLPLGEAFRIAAAVNRDASLAAGAERIAAEMEQGNSALEAVRASEALPRDVVPIFRWVDRRPLLVEALQAAAEMYASRCRIQSGLMAVLLEPVLVLGIGLTAGMVVIALYMPLIKLLNDLA